LSSQDGGHRSTLHRFLPCCNDLRITGWFIHQVDERSQAYTGAVGSFLQ
jgi:hypothetical protein